MPKVSQLLVQAVSELTRALGDLKFSEPVAYVYNPLVYAAKSHERYVRKFGNTSKQVVFLGMNPGPFGMAQTGVPFGEIAAVRDWMGIDEPIGKPWIECPKRPVEGFACTRSEVSGRRLWGWAAEKYTTPEAFFADNFVINYCPLVWMEEGGRNITPDKLPAAEMEPVHSACTEHLRRALDALQPDWAIGVGAFAERQLISITPSLKKTPKTGKILHPSPASPAANKGWAEKATRQLEELGVW
jgi:single-strand selective monofunctional uracil DNA glycosylase